MFHQFGSSIYVTCSIIHQVCMYQRFTRQENKDRNIIFKYAIAPVKTHAAQPERKKQKRLGTLISLQRLVPCLLVQTLLCRSSIRSGTNGLGEIARVVVLCKSAWILLATNIRVETRVISIVIVEPAFAQILSIRPGVAYILQHGCHVCRCFSAVVLASVAAGMSSTTVFFRSLLRGGIFVRSEAKVLFGLCRSTHVASFRDVGSWVASLSA